ncbi:unnamed protein product [Musa textilis]
MPACSGAARAAASAGSITCGLISSAARSPPRKRSSSSTFTPSSATGGLRLRHVCLGGLTMRSRTLELHHQEEAKELNQHRRSQSQSSNWKPRRCKGAPEAVCVHALITTFVFFFPVHAWLLCRKPVRPPAPSWRRRLWRDQSRRLLLPRTTSFSSSWHGDGDGEGGLMGAGCELFVPPLESSQEENAMNDTSGVDVSDGGGVFWEGENMRVAQWELGDLMKDASFPFPWFPS